MKSFISFALLLSVSFLSAGTAGERIAVPLRWERNRTAASCQFEKIGAAEDSGNYVFAFTVAGLPELTAEKGSISVYWRISSSISGCRIRASMRFSGRTKRNAPHFPCRGRICILP